MKSNYEFPREQLTRYSKLTLSRLNNGKGLIPGQVVLLNGATIHAPLLEELSKAIHLAGGHVVTQIILGGVNRQLLDVGTDEQISFALPVSYWESLVSIADIQINITGPAKMRAFEGADQHKMKLLKEVGKVPNRLFKTKRDAGKLDGTIVLFPTPAMAEEVGLNYEEYCHQFELGLQLDKVDPELAWDMINAELKKTKTRLNQVPLASVIIEGQDFYLELGIGEDRQWLTADGKNIPSYETYITPDWTKTNGNIRFSEPLYYMGNLISGIELIFKNGIITEVKAERNQDFFRNMIAAYANADKVGEFSLTEGGVSPITHLMGSTLFDENRGGPNGNTHIAIGAAYTESKRGEKLTRTDEEWHNDGYNNCPDFHVDIVHTGKFTVHGITASSGIKFLLFKNGKLVI